jgi:primosomal protein N' (replication factor Y)
MPYAEVSVNSPFAQRKAFSYSVPAGLELTIGQAIWVPFGEKTLQGIVLELTSQPQVAETREIAGAIEKAPLLSPALVSLAGWLSEYYLSPLFDCIALMLPPGFSRSIESYYAAAQGVSLPRPDLEDEPGLILQYLSEHGRASLKELGGRFSQMALKGGLGRLVRRGLVEKTYQLQKPRIQAKTAPFLSLKIPAADALKLADSLARKSPKQAQALRSLSELARPVVLGHLRAHSSLSRASLNALAEKGLVEIREMRVERDPLAGQSVNLSFPLALTAPQEAVFQAVLARLSAGPQNPAARTFLLRGVTGSGKTEIYLRLLAEAIKRNKRAIVLVPEISMTPQIIERFISRFPGRVAVLHSGLSPGERFDEWWRIKNGEFDVVVGPRSAVFAPQPDLGLIIIDEEHEWTYKQQDSPRYHARRVAEKLAELSDAVLVLGSATPDVESYYSAERGRYHLVELQERVTTGEPTRLPAVEVADLRDELKAGNLTIFSRSLRSSIGQALSSQEQVILFLNRRGSSSFVECRNCGFVIYCRRCQIPLSYHAEEDRLVCHRCNYRQATPLNCPRCRSGRIKYLGLGTEKLLQETAKAFPQARLLRWDSDVVRGHAQMHRQIFEKFRRREADILIGTQMIAKGLDLPAVTLVGIINADIALNLPDFRANEHTFQLLSQVAGRAGRGTRPGKVIVQTYSPENYAIRAAAAHDYPGFYRQEIAYRAELRDPPFSRLARLIYTHANLQRCREEVERVKKMFLALCQERGIAGIEIIGPAPAYLERLRGRYRWQIILRGADPAVFLSPLVFPRGWAIDIDPLGTG